MIPRVELLLLEDNNECSLKMSLGSSGVEQSPEKACVGGANPSRGTTKLLNSINH